MAEILQKTTRWSERWPDKLVSQLKEMHALGLSGSDIAMRLDGDFTRNAIIGKLHRLGLRKSHSSPKKVQRIRSARKRPARLDFATVQKSADVPVAPAFILPSKPDESLRPAILTGVPFADMGSNQCWWPTGPDGQHLFCGASTPAGKSYCREHHKRVYVRVQTRRFYQASSNQEAA